MDNIHTYTFTDIHKSISTFLFNPITISSFEHVLPSRALNFIHKDDLKLNFLKSVPLDGFFF